MKAIFIVVLGDGIFLTKFRNMAILRLSWRGSGNSKKSFVQLIYVNIFINNSFCNIENKNYKHERAEKNNLETTILCLHRKERAILNKKCKNLAYLRLTDRSSSLRHNSRAKFLYVISTYP